MSGQTLITSRDDKGRHAVNLFAIEYDKAKLDAERAQRLNERGGELQEGIAKLIAELSVPNQYADEEVSSDYEYPEEYKGPKPIEEQVKALAKTFDLDPAGAFEYAKSLPELPDGAEGWFAIPSVHALAARFFPEVKDSAEQYCPAVNLVLQKIGESRRFYNYREGQITSDRLRVHARTAYALDLIATETQRGNDILIVAAQLGMRHRGRSVRRARKVFAAKEFGLGTLAVGSILLSHPERLSQWEELDMDCAGDEFAPDADGRFGEAPFFFFGGEVGLGTGWFDVASGYFGAVSAFLPQ